jgi:hypothetical protein
MKSLEPKLITSFIMMNEFLQRNQFRYCLIGGIAAGYWGEPRFTQDMDFTVASSTKDLSPLIKACKRDGFVTKIKGEDQLQILQHGKLTFQADIILAATNYQDWVVQRAKPVTIFETSVPICTPEDLIILKLIANRRQDLLDIEMVLKNQQPKLDTAYLKKWFEFWELTDRFEQEFGPF